MKTLVFWDSIARGAFDERWWRVERLKWEYLKWWQEKYRHGVYNFSISWMTSRELLIWFENALQWFRLTISDDINIVVNVGSNDATGEWTNTPTITIEEYEKNIREITEIGKKFTQSIILLWNIQIDETLTLPMSYGDYWLLNSNQLAYNNILKDIADQEWYMYIDSWNWIDPKTDLDDGVHPNTQWHEKIFIEMKNVLSSIITHD